MNGSGRTDGVSAEARAALAAACGGLGAFRIEADGEIVLDARGRALFSVDCAPHRFLDLVLSEDRARLAAAIERARSGAEFAEAFRAVGADGVVRALFARGASAGRSIEGFVREGTGAGADGDVHTARREAERRLKAYAERLESAERAAGALTYDARDGRVWRSGGLTRILGWTPDEIAPTLEGWRALWHPDDLAALQPERPRAGPYAHEYRVRHKQGHYVWVLDRGEATLAPDGGYARLVGSTMDITARKRLEEELTESAERLASALRAAELGVHDYDRSTGEIRWNAAVRRIWGFDDDVPVTLELFESGVHPDDLPGVRAAVEAAFDPRGPLRFEARYRVVNREDGRIRQVKVDGDIERNAAGVPTRLVGTVQDVTERLRGEGALRRIASRHAYLVELSDALRTLDDPAAIQETAARLLGRRLGARRVGYAERFGDDPATIEVVQNWTDGAVDIRGRHRLTDFDAALSRRLAAGETVIHADVAADVVLRADERAARSALGIGAVADKPIVRNGALVAILFVHFDGPHAWTAEELELLDETGERAWAAIERARAVGALEESRQRMEYALAAARMVAFSWEPTGLVVHTDDRISGEKAQFERREAYLAIMHPDDRAAVASSFEARFRDGGDYRMQYRIQNGAGGWRWVESVGRAVVDRDGVRRMRGVIRDISEQKAAEEALVASENRFRVIVETAQEGIWAIDAQGRTTLANPKMAEMLDYDLGALDGAPLSAFVFPEDEAVLMMRKARNDEGRAQQFEMRFRRKNGSALHVLAATAPLYDADGAVVGSLGGFLDLGERLAAEERQRVLVNEVMHRGRNLLAVVQSMARRTLVDPRPLAEARETFLGRLQALSRTYASITHESFEGAAIADIVEAELGGVSGRAEMRGPDVTLSPKAAQTFTLVVHELATNAAKHGALSVPAGKVRVEWSVVGAEGARRLLFRWRERGGPPVETPSREGFGSTLITVVAGADLSCTPWVEYAPDGLVYGFEAPLAGIGVLAESAVRGALGAPVLRAFFDAWSAVRRPGGAPLMRDFPIDRFRNEDAFVLVAIQGDGARFLELGRALKAELGVDTTGEMLTRSHVEAYLQCARKAAPCFERASWRFGDDDAVAFERLLVPLSLSGEGVTHVAGLVLLSDAAPAADAIEEAAAL